MAGRRRVDWSFGPGHGPVSGVLNAAAAAYAAAAIAYLVDRDLAPVNPVWLLLAGAVAAVASVVAARWQQAPERALLFRVVCWLAAGLWGYWVLCGTWWVGSPTNPWTVPAVVVLAIGVLAAAIVGTSLARLQRRDDDLAAAKAAEAQSVPVNAGDADAVAADWQARLRAITRKDVTVVGVEFWDPPTGFTLDGDLPADGTTVDDVKVHEKALATAANLHVGCGVEVLAGETGRRQILVRVATENAMAEDHHLPADYSAATIENDISIGIQPDRQPALINLRYDCATLVGQTDSGKSNELNVITCGLVRCTDDLVWAIDISGNGRYPRPWVRAWKEGRAAQPAIDWVATDDGEAELMCLAALQVVNGRTAEYQDLMFAQGSDKIVAAPDLPQVTIVVDEFGTLRERVKDLLNTISDTGRGAAVRVVSCALEASAKYIPRSMITQSRVRIGMRVVDEAQLQYLFDTVWSRGRFDPAAAPYKGSGRWAVGAVPPGQFKGWRMEPARVDEAAVAVAPLRPVLDEVSVRLADTVVRDVKDDRGVPVKQRVTAVYADRWVRVLPRMFPDTDAPKRPTTARPTAAPATSGTETSGTETHVNDLGAALANLEAKKQALRDAVAAAETEGERPDPEPDAEVARLNALLAEEMPARDRMRQLVAQSGDAGTGPGPVHERLRAEGYPTSYPTVVEWMKADVAAGWLAQPGGDRTPYFPGPKLRGA